MNETESNGTECWFCEGTGTHFDGNCPTCGGDGELTPIRGDGELD